MVPFVPKLATTPTTNISKTPIFKRLTQQERKERTTKGLCFNCDDKFIHGHKCKARLFRLSVDESCLWEVEKLNEGYEVEYDTTKIQIGQGNTKISLNAFTTGFLLFCEG